MTTTDLLLEGRQAWERRAWSEAYSNLSAALAADEGALEFVDFEHLSMAAELIGRREQRTEILTLLHQRASRAGDYERAALAAFWCGFGLASHGEFARAGGWFGRAASMVQEHELDSVVRGYLRLPAAIQAQDEHRNDDALAAFTQAGEIAAKFGDQDLATLSRLGRGSSKVLLGHRSEGLALVDEAMVAVTANEVSPVVVGIVYCASIELYRQVFDLRRAQEWTAALSRWCEVQPDLVPFRGACLLYRAELMQFHGAWQEADEEAHRAFIRLTEPPPPEPAVGEVHYRQAELYRLRGAFAEAEAAYRQASAWGQPVEPGLALLRFAQGDADGAWGMIHRALDEAGDPSDRLRLLGPYVEIALARRETAAAKAAAEELRTGADATNAPLLDALALRSNGAVQLADGDARSALATLRHAWSAWQELDAPYEAARVRVLMGEACRALGDEAGAGIEFDAARETFGRLGAAPDLVALEGRYAATARAAASSTSTGGLTTREVEILRLVAAGKTNRAIADELVISEKTVARHVSNIFTKLDVSSRSAATAYAYEHGLAGKANAAT